MKWTVESEFHNPLRFTIDGGLWVLLIAIHPSAGRSKRELEPLPSRSHVEEAIDDRFIGGLMQIDIRTSNQDVLT